jgi:putative oxidoreductase
MKALAQPHKGSFAGVTMESRPGVHWKLLNSVLQTQPSWPAVVARLTLAMVMFPHGAQKTFGWFNGYGFSGTMNFFIGTMHIPWLFALAAILAEALGPIALAAGFGARIAAAVIAIDMTVAALTSHIQNGFMMDWFRNQKGEGFEYHLLAIGLCAVVILLGGGTGSMDLKLSRRLSR